MKRADFDNIISFLDSGKQMIPALTYQADVIELYARQPDLSQMVTDTKEILMIAAQPDN